VKSNSFFFFVLNVQNLILEVKRTSDKIQWTEINAEAILVTD